MKVTKHYKKAFSLTELVVVMGIIAVLIVLGLLGFNILQKNDRDNKRKVVLNSLTNAVEDYRRRYSAVPAWYEVDFDPVTRRFSVGSGARRTYYDINTFVQNAPLYLNSGQDPAGTTSTITKYSYDALGNSKYRLCVLLESGGIFQIGQYDCPANHNTWPWIGPPN